MQENILEHTTSIAGLTCKPLAILSETISPQEMSRARGGNGGERPHNVNTRFDPGSSTSGLAGRVTPGSGEGCEIGCFEYCCDEGPQGDEGPQNLAFPTFGGSGGGGGGGGDVLGPFGGGGGGSSSNSDATNDDEDHLGNFWDFDFDDDTEDECTVPYDCGDDEEEEDYSEEETQEDTVVYDP